MGSSTFNTGYQLAHDIASNSQAIAALNSKTDIVTKYLNDTTKTGLALLTADFSSIGTRETRFYSIRPSDDNLFGFFTRFNDNYGAGFFTNHINNKTYQIQNSNGTWTKEELAQKSDVPIKDLLTNLETKTITINKAQPIIIEVFRNYGGENKYIKFVISANVLVEVERIGFDVNQVVLSYNDGTLTLKNNVNGYVYYTVI